MNSQPIWVPGKPALAGTPADRQWKEQIQHHAASRQAGKHIYVRFQLPETASGSGAAAGSLEAYCEPVLAVLIQKLGWMGGKRQQLAGWRAVKAVEEPHGLKIWADDRKAIEPPEALYGEPALDFLFEGTIPQKTTDPYLSELLKKMPMSLPGDERSSLAVCLRFGGSKINIGEVGVGPIKAILAGLFPIIGGDAAKPDDWRIGDLEVQKNAPGVKENTVQISIWQRG